MPYAGACQAGSYAGISGATMLLPADQRRLLGAFLRSHREKLAPSAAGLGAFGRRRTPGLRREEVAQSCGLSTTWYTWMEQGRDISLSAPALARLATALQLTAAERAYLFELARQRDPAPIASLSSRPEPAPIVPPELLVVLRATTVPAYLLDRLWCAQGWNDAAGRLFSPWFSSGELCLLRYVFLHPSAPGFIYGWEDRAKRLIAEFRTDTAHDPTDPVMQDLVRGLARDSACFAQFWDDHSVLTREGGIRSFNHPEDGTLCYEQITFVPTGHPSYKLVQLLPRP